MHLVVVNPFGSYQRGDKITDAKAMEKALAENPHDVVRARSPAKAS